YGKVVTTSITNMDVHDIARSCRTYGVRRFYVAHPTPALRALAERIVEHWRSGYGSRYNPSRYAAISLVEVSNDLEQTIAAVEQDSGRMPTLVATSARPRSGAWTYGGLADDVLDRCDAQLEPIRGTADYNHLSVRAAAAIVLDRLARPSE